MSKKWNATEFFKMMAENEQAVSALYRQLAGNAKLGVKFFENLADDEDRHYKIYTALLQKNEAGTDLTVEVSDEYEQYLNALVENNWLKDTEKLLAEVALITDKDKVYELAEKAEKDAVLFVGELIHLYPYNPPADFVVVQNEERNHLKQVLNRRMESKLTTLRL